MHKGNLSKELRKLIAIIVLEIAVFGIAVGIVIRFFSGYADIYNAVIILLISAVGITLIVYGNARRNRYLNVLGFLILLFGVYTAIEVFEGFAAKISAFATLAVAIAAFAAIEENRRVRQDSIERESRDRKERLADEVAKWLRELEGHIFAVSGRLMATISEMEDRLKGSRGIGFEEWLKIMDLDLALEELGNVTEAMKEAEYYEKLTLQVDRGVSELIGVIRNNVEERQKIRLADVEYRRHDIRKTKEGQSVDELRKDDDRTLERSASSVEDTISGKLERNSGAIRESIQRAIEKTIELKVSLISIS